MKSLCCCAALLLAVAAGRADVVSGPKVGDKAEDFTAHGVVGIIDGKDGSYIKERKGDPTIYVFVSAENFQRPTAQFLKGLDAALKDAPGKAAVVAVWLTEKPDMIKEYLPKAQMSLNFVNTSLGVFKGDKSGPKNWGINPDAHVTVVAVKDNKVTAVSAYESINGTDVRKVLTAAKLVDDTKNEPKKKDEPKRK